MDYKNKFSKNIFTEVIQEEQKSIRKIKKIKVTTTKEILQEIYNFERNIIQEKWKNENKLLLFLIKINNILFSKLRILISLNK